MMKTVSIDRKEKRNLPSKKKVEKLFIQTSSSSYYCKSAGQRSNIQRMLTNTMVPEFIPLQFTFVGSIFGFRFEEFVVIIFRYSTVTAMISS